MADQRAPSLSGLSKQISKAITHRTSQFIDSDKIARAVLDACMQTSGADVDDVDPEELAYTIGATLPKALHKKTIAATITRILRGAGFTDELATDVPAANASGSNALATGGGKPPTSMDAVALREQILANARVVHSLHNHQFPVHLATTELVVTCDDKAGFSASVVRFRPGQNLIITMEVAGGESAAQALEMLLRVSCTMLGRLRGLARSKGGGLAEWAAMRLQKELCG